MKITLLLISLLFVSSCAIPMSGESFQDEVRRVSATKSFRSGSKSKILYKGSDEKYHYFKIVPNIGIPRPVKVTKDELPLSEEFEYSDEEEKWLDYELVQ